LTVVIWGEDLPVLRIETRANFLASCAVCVASPLPLDGGVAEVLPWRPRRNGPRRSSNPNSPSNFLNVGAYAGRARFRPTARAALTPALERAVGQIVEVAFAGYAAKDEMFAGQALYLEWRSDVMLDGFLIPEQDLEFL
jgi:hypothetical protein